MPLTIAAPRSADAYMGLPQSDYISSNALAAGVAETIQIPSGAYAVLFSATDHFVALIQASGAVVAALWPVDVTDGTAKGELNPTLRKLRATDTQISVIANSPTLLTVSFFVKPA
jgi:hypothetical protein